MTLLKKQTVSFFEALLQSHIFGTELIKPSTLIDFDFLGDLMVTHRLIMPFFLLIKKYFPAKFSLENKIKLRYIRQLNQQIKMKQCLFKIINLLNEKKIAYIVLKGLPLNQQLYGKKMLRTFRDIDILINQNDLLKTHNILLDSGYILNSPKDVINLSKNDSLLKVMKDLVYIHTTENIIVELHWNITQMPFMNFAKAGDKNNDTIQIDNQIVSVLNPESNFLYLCVHAAFHNWERLQWLVDIAIHHQKIVIDWNKLIVLAEQYYCIRPLLEAQLLLKKMFDIELPAIQASTKDKFAVKIRLFHTEKIFQLKNSHDKAFTLNPYVEVFYYTFLATQLRQKWLYIYGLFLQGSKNVKI